MPKCGARTAVNLPVLAPLFLAASLGPSFAALPTGQATPDRAYIGLIIDDLGNSLAEGERAARLPGSVAGAILPHTAHSRDIARVFTHARKEVLLHLPMQSLRGEEVTSGPGTLEAGMSAHELAHMVAYNLETVPQASGINNHMGSLLTRERVPMQRLMQALQERGLFFVDSVTTPDSVAAQVAREQRVPVLTRNVFLDNERGTSAITQQLETLVRIARERGFALGIGHPYPETLDALERWIPTLAHHQIELVPLTTLLTLPERRSRPIRAHYPR